MTSRSGLPAGRETVRPRVRRLGPAILLTTLLVVLQISFAGVAGADGGDFSLDFASATPGTYNQTTGTGGTWDDVVQQLNGGDFVCGDVVQHLTEVVVDDGATGTQDIVITYSFDTETTSGGQVGYGDVTYASINTGDPNNSLSGNETVSLASVQTVGEEIVATVEVTGLDAGEVLIVSVGAQLACNEDPDNVTGNVHATLEDAETSLGDPINTGNDDTPLINLDALGEPEPEPDISVTKECTAEVEAGADIEYTITITNTGEEAVTIVSVEDTLLFPGTNIADMFDQSLDPGESTSQNFSIPAPDEAGTVTNTVTVVATGDESEVEATSGSTCETTVTGEPGEPGEPELPVTGFDGALPLALVLGLALAVVVAGAGLRIAARRRS